VVPSSKQVNPKALAHALGEKKVKVTTEREAEKLTGLQAGGISPLALFHRPFAVILDETAKKMDSLIISGGQRGFNLKMGVEDFVKLTQAQIAPICQ
jgi:Cys-tRNA(Pro)/Cys-tRNA(Cys) deacylase